MDSFLWYGMKVIVDRNFWGSGLQSLVGGGKSTEIYGLKWAGMA